MAARPQDVRKVGSNSVSVAMCTYNGAQFLHEQLESISKQTLLPTEVVICDDRSSDDTVEIVSAFAHTAPFAVRLLSNAEQLGTTRNFEKAMRLCNGRFIALCDQDDVWNERKLEVLVRLLENHPDADGAFSDALLIDSKSNPTGRRLWQNFRFRRAKQQIFLCDPVTLLLKHDVVTGATFLIRASLLGKFTQIPTSWLHDAWLTWMIALYGQFQLTPKQLTSYRVHAFQQLGTGRSATNNRTESRTALELERYRRVAAQFRDLLEYVRQSDCCDSRLASLLDSKQAFLEERSRLPESWLKRLVFVIKHASKYRRYARGVHSISKDLLL